MYLDRLVCYGYALYMDLCSCTVCLTSTYGFVLRKPRYVLANICVYEIHSQHQGLRQGKHS